MKKNNQMAALAQRQYGTLVSERTSSSFRQKKLQRRRSGNSTSRSKQIKFSKRDKSQNNLPSQPRFIRNKHIKQSAIQKKQIDQYNQNTTKNYDIQCIAGKSRIQFSSFELRVHNQTGISQNSLQKLNQKNRFQRSKSYKFKQNQQTFQKQYNQLRKQYNKIKQQLKQSNLLNQKQQQIIKQLQLKIINLAYQLQQNEKVVLEKLQQIQSLNQRFFSKSKITQTNQLLKIEPGARNIGSFSFIIDNMEKTNVQYFVEMENNSKSRSNVCDISQQMENLKCVASLNEKIKYQEVEIVMLKRLIEKSKDQCDKKDRQVRVLSQRIRNMSAKLDLRGNDNKARGNSKYYEDQQSLTFEISIDSNNLIL